MSLSTGTSIIVSIAAVLYLISLAARGIVNAVHRYTWRKSQRIINEMTEAIEVIESTVDAVFELWWRDEEVRISALAALKIKAKMDTVRVAVPENFNNLVSFTTIYQEVEAIKSACRRVAYYKFGRGAVRDLTDRLPRTGGIRAEALRQYNKISHSVDSDFRVMYDFDVDMARFTEHFTPSK